MNNISFFKWGIILIGWDKVKINTIFETSKINKNCWKHKISQSQPFSSWQIDIQILAKPNFWFCKEQYNNYYYTQLNLEKCFLRIWKNFVIYGHCEHSVIINGLCESVKSYKISKLCLVIHSLDIIYIVLSFINEIILQYMTVITANSATWIDDTKLDSVSIQK